MSDKSPKNGLSHTLTDQEYTRERFRFTYRRAVRAAKRKRYITDKEAKYLLQHPEEARREASLLLYQFEGAEALPARLDWSKFIDRLIEWMPIILKALLTVLPFLI